MRNLINTTIDHKFKGKKLKDFLRFDLDLSSRMLKNLAKHDQIFINRKIVRLNYLVKGGEKLTINLDKDETMDIKPVCMPLTIVYEDDSLIVVDKPPYLVVHPTKRHQEDTLTNGLLYYFREKNENNIVRFISRLDMNTSGLIMVAKNQFSHSYFARLPETEKIVKEYLGITEGEFASMAGTIDEPINRDAEPDHRHLISPEGQRAVTHYQVLHSSCGFSLVRFTLDTGRTHQIRIHTAHLGHPIVHDNLYGANQDPLDERQFLHAAYLKFTHPMTRQVIELQSDLPVDMKNFILAKTDWHSY